MRGITQRGMTLLETLVTLVIVAMVASLVSEGLFQVARLEQRLGASQLQADVERLHAIWIQQALEALMPGQKDSPDRFRGRARELSGVSTQLPVASPRGPQPVRLTIQFNQDTGRTEVIISFGLAEQRQQSAVLVQWAGDRGSWRYQDKNGVWLEQWPPAFNSGAQVPTALPQAIALDRGEGLGVLLVARPISRAEPLSQKIDLDKLP